MGNSKANTQTDPTYTFADITTISYNSEPDIRDLKRKPRPKTRNEGLWWLEGEERKKPSGMKIGLYTLPDDSDSAVTSSAPFKNAVFPAFMSITSRYLKRFISSTYLTPAQIEF
jgi:hypothetical protein